MAVNSHDRTIKRILQKKWRKFKRNVVEPISMFIFIVIGLVLSPLLVPIGLLLYERDQKRMYAIAEKFRCMACGVVLGMASIQRSNDEHGRYMNELHSQFPDAYSISSDWPFDAICANCGTGYVFSQKTRSFSKRNRTNPNHRWDLSTWQSTD
jgi:hypothetical protein